MELIDRYVLAVGRHLPAKKRADIQSELRSSLMDSLEARAPGNPTEDDVVALLKEVGPPEKVAASYWPEGQYLIGPSLFPLFRMVVGIALTVFVVVQLVALGAALIFDPQAFPVWSFLGDIVDSVFFAFGVIVIVFVVLQYFGVRPQTGKEEWDPRNLPAIDQPDQVKRTDLVIEITLSLVFLAILLFLPDRLGFVVHPGGEIILNPLLPAFLPWIGLAILLSIVLDVFLLWRGRWEIWSRLLKIGVNLFGIVLLVYMIMAHNAWLAERGASGFLSMLENLPGGAIPAAGSVQIMVMQVFRMAFIIALIVTVIETVRQVYFLGRRLISGSSTPAVPAAG